METISILGLGRAGGALAIALRRAGTQIGPLIYRGSKPSLDGFRSQDLVSFSGLDRIDSDILLIATADQDIWPTSVALSSFNALPNVVLHLSGSLASDELDDLRSKGVAIGSMHPLVSISDATLGADRFSAAYFCVEGDMAAVGAAEAIVESLGGKHFSIETRLKPLYHASAVMASGNVTALFDGSIEMLSKCGVEPGRAHTILLPLLKSTVANLSQRSTKAALTGPLVRGDATALNRHLHAFEGTVDDALRSIYLDLADRSVRLAGLPNSEELLDAISVAKRKIGC